MEGPGQNNGTRQTNTTSREVTSGLSSHMYGPIKPPSLIFLHLVEKWKEFWDAFEASIDKAKYALIDNQ